MQPWVWAVLFCAAVLAIGYVVDRKARAERAGLERPADTKGRSKVHPVVQARIDHPGSAGVAYRQEGGDAGAGNVVM